MWGKNDIEADSQKIGIEGSSTRVVKIFTPPQKQNGVILEGSPQEIVENFINDFKQYL